MRFAAAHKAVVNGEVLHAPSYHAHFRRLQGEAWPAFLPFDLLQVDGEDIRKWPQSQRMDALRKILKDASSPFIRDWIPQWEFDLDEERPADDWQEQKDFFGESIEGFVIKPKDSAYFGGDNRRIARLRCYK